MFETLALWLSVSRQVPPDIRAHILVADQTEVENKKHGFPCWNLIEILFYFERVGSVDVLRGIHFRW